MLLAISVVLAAALLGGMACALRPAAPDGDLAERIDALLPQWQCAQCGYPGCRPYAEAVARGAASIDRCPPGGDRAVARLATLLGSGAAPAAAGAPRAAAPALARIDEAACIGCVKCVRACPVDAILGAAGQMHAVIPALCTGCGLCVAPCPVDCIAMVPAAATPQAGVWLKPGGAAHR